MNNRYNVDESEYEVYVSEVKFPTQELVLGLILFTLMHIHFNALGQKTPIDELLELPFLKFIAFSMVVPIIISVLPAIVITIASRHKFLASYFLSFKYTMLIPIGVGSFYLAKSVVKNGMFP